MLSKILIKYLVEKLTLEEIISFNKTVLIPQDAKNLSAHFIAAEEVVRQQNQEEEKKEDETKAKEKENKSFG